ncbi:Type III restriction protein, restriction subunit (plasmid) [Aurantiacibacter atlanticus]|uniref:Type III restriction protein, restriction subunit n=1 Tax=Aurantiacibacter atlanticus TaxID=1648404 RepID=A0A161I4F7_9SPHN|nr:DEAD/DEAH box helicase family protein [Aurantiacibacter atlanticus]ANC50591.1 Type III restriction protein, restriction subunit [Aurantiacibacter atlanticus]MAM39929.1 type III restriction endonuclease subunit R [Erythrobacter sp.]
MGKADERLPFEFQDATEARMVMATSLSSNSNGYSGNLASLDLETEYRSLKDDPVEKFYACCLREAKLYRRAAGYFRSSVFLVVGPAIVSFVRKGGRIELICSPALDAGDVERITEGYAKRGSELASILIKQFDTLLANPQTALGAKTLATLIAVGSLDLKIAMRRDRRGIYHEKIGIFSDAQGNRVSFKGSANETWSGWSNDGNFESIEVFCSWRGGLEADRIDKHDAHFDRLWSAKDEDIEVCSLPETAKEYFEKFASPDLASLPSEETIEKMPRRVPMPHQANAIERWIKAGRRGIFEHATGSGKTFTAITAIRQHILEGKPALILVPSRLLLSQWADEVADEIPEAALLLAGAGNNKWRGSGRLPAMTDADVSLGPRIIISTMPTAASEEFRANVTAGDHLLVVADEVHQIGSRENSKFLATEAGARLGLSATPKRYGDSEGTERIFSYFGPIVLPKITLMDAVDAGRLVCYEYHPHPVHLSATEAEDWLIQSRAISKEIARSKSDNEGRKALSERARMMLIKRARIAKKAAAKVSLATRVMVEEFEPGQSWLVYCEDGDQLAEVLNALRESGLDPIEYHSSMEGDREATMDWFRRFGGILVSIRCLDEGVDIPAVSHALILASSQNPRQFIQRRGRVLRKSPGKDIAVIHDAIVTPVNPDEEEDQMGLLRAELVRSVEFAKNAINQMAAANLREIAIEMGIDPDDFDPEEGDEIDD